MPTRRAGPTSAPSSQKSSPVAAKERGETRIDGLDLLHDSLGYTIKRAQVRAYDMLFATLGADALTPGRMTALSFIGTEPGISQSVLAERLGINRPSVVKVVDSLEALNLIERQPVEGDRRSYSLTLTAHGRSELKALHRKVRQYEAAISAKLSVEERQQLITLLDKVAG